MAHCSENPDADAGLKVQPLARARAAALAEPGRVAADSGVPDLLQWSSTNTVKVGSPANPTSLSPCPHGGRQRPDPVLEDRFFSGFLAIPPRALGTALNLDGWPVSEHGAPMSQNDANAPKSTCRRRSGRSYPDDDVNCKRTMMGLAACFKRLASHAEQRETAIARSDGPSEKRTRRRS